MVNGYAGLSERKFRKWVQMDANTPLCHSERPLCHSEHSEESRPGKGKRFIAYALNDKCPNAEEHPPPAPLQRGEERSEGGMLSLQRGKSGKTKKSV
ncbi:hypothetical protein BGK60_11665 [Tannerella forsythia]|nr:hypothetical protein BGK60_11665 [Tannerella forsythia]